MTELSITERVAAGAQLLDEERPLWLRDADPDTLDLADPYNCIGKQLFGDWFELVHDLFAGDLETAALYGFTHAVTLTPDMSREEYKASVVAEFEALTVAWRKEINDRRAADDTVDVAVLG